MECEDDADALIDTVPVTVTVPAMSVFVGLCTSEGDGGGVRVTVEFPLLLGVTVVRVVEDTVREVDIVRVLVDTTDADFDDSALGLADEDAESDCMEEVDAEPEGDGEDDVDAVCDAEFVSENWLLADADMLKDAVALDDEDILAEPDALKVAARETEELRDRRLDADDRKFDRVRLFLPLGLDVAVIVDVIELREEVLDVGDSDCKTDEVAVTLSLAV
jgi:hypothetical protein